MTTSPLLRPLAREVIASVFAQRAFSGLLFAVILASMVTIILTGGRSEAAQAAVLQTIDGQGTRSITVQIKTVQAELPFELIDELNSVEQIRGVVGFGPANDVTAASLPGGTRVALRPMYDPETSVAPRKGPVFSARSTPDAARLLGMPSGVGTVSSVEGLEYQVSGTLNLPRFLRVYEPMVASPVDAKSGVELTNATIVVESADAVRAVTKLVRSYFLEAPPESYSISTSEQLAKLRGVVDGELTRQGRATVTWVASATSTVTLLIVAGFVVLRRRDFGRRRALGATRMMIASIVLGQVLLVALCAIVAGAGSAILWMMASDGTAPPLPYVVAVSVMLACVCAVAAVVPAIAAASRDPMRELRVP